MFSTKKVSIFDRGLTPIKAGDKPSALQFETVDLEVV
jgi:hypothetical protein